MKGRNRPKRVSPVASPAGQQRYGRTDRPVAEVIDLLARFGPQREEEG